MNLNPLGIVREMVEAAGMEVVYAYEDLVFLGQNGFLLQFTENPDRLLIHINQDAERHELKDDLERLKKNAAERNLILADGGLYSLIQQDDENIRLEFTAADLRDNVSKP